MLALMDTLLVYGAPKLGHVLFDPLTYEANKHDFSKLKAILREVITEEDKTTTKSCSSCTKDVTIKTIPRRTEIPEIKPTLKTNKDSLSKVSDLFKLFEGALDKVKPANQARRQNDDGSNKAPCAGYNYNGAICRFVKNRLLCGYDTNKGEIKTDDIIDMGGGCRMVNERIECGYQTPPFDNIRRPPARDEPIKDIARQGSDNVMKSFARSVLKAISEHEIKFQNSTNDSRSESSSTTESSTENVSSKSTEDTKSTKADFNSTFTTITDFNTTVTSSNNSTVPKTIDTTTEPLNLQTETSINVTEPVLVTIPVMEYLLKYIIPYRMFSESLTTSTLPPTTVHTSDLPVSEAAIERTSSESDEFLTNDINIDYDGSSLASSTPISEVSDSTSTRLFKVFRRSADELKDQEKSTQKLPLTREGNKPWRRCVEKGDRIVCYYSDNSFVLD